MATPSAPVPPGKVREVIARHMVASGMEIVPDLDEGDVDSDGDDIPDYLDRDSEDDGLADAHYARALAHMDLGRFEDSRVDILRAVALSPNHIEAVFLGGLLSDFRGQLAEAVRYFQRALELNPRFSRTVALARTMLLLSREVQALDVGRRGARLEPGAPMLHFAHVLTLAGEHEEALMMCSEALAREVPRARNLCGFSALLAGEMGLAEYLLSEDWQQDPRAQWGPFAFAASATHLALLRQASGDWAAADGLLNQSEAVTLAARAAGSRF